MIQIHSLTELVSRGPSIITIILGLILGVIPVKRPHSVEKAQASGNQG
jgi:hypothetical protein